MSQSGKLTTVAVFLSALAILFSLLFGQEKIPQVETDLTIWVSRQEQQVLHLLSRSEKELLQEVLSHQRRRDDGDLYEDFVLSFGAYEDGAEVLQPSLYRLTDGTNDFVMKYPDGGCYGLDTRSVLQLLTSKTMDGLFDYVEEAPVMTVSDGRENITVHCAENGWQYKKIDNSVFMDGVLVKDETRLLETEAYQNLSLQFSAEPQQVLVEIMRQGEDQPLFIGIPDKLDNFNPPLNGVYQMKVTARWVETKNRRYSGTCIYQLDLQVKKAAETSVSVEQAAPGSLFAITVTNPAEPGSLQVESSLGPSSRFVQLQEGVYGCIVAAQVPGSHNLTVTGTELLSTHTVTVLPRQETEEPTVRFPLESVGESRLLEDVWQDVLRQAGRNKYWYGPFRRPLEQEPQMGFAQSFVDQPQQTLGASWWLLEEEQVLRTTGAGVVSFVGELEGVGLTVGIDHGLGLFSWFYGLSETELLDGMVVLAGSEIGRVLPEEDEELWCGVQTVLNGVPLDGSLLWGQTWLE